MWSGCLLWLGLSAGAAGAGQDDRRPAPVSTAINAPSSYVVGADDLLNIQVLNVPEIGSRPFRVDTTGELRLPMIGRVPVTGLSLGQLEAELTRRFAEYVQEPDVSVSVAEFHSQPVSIVGAVAQSGVHQLRGRKTLIEMLSGAGGATGDAGPAVRVTRQLEWGPIPLADARTDTGAGISTVEIDLRALLAGTAPEKNILMRPHDVIAVPRAEVVYVIGEVARAGPVPLSNGHSVSVMEAVSSAGGTLRTAKPAAARILRRSPATQTRTEVDVDVVKIMRGQASDVPLLAGDILIVPDSAGKRAAARILEAAIQTGVAVLTYGVVR
jgi:polysaccharide export outer membrane protein